LIDTKDSLFIDKEFFATRKLRTLQSANQNSPDKSGSDSDLLLGQISRPRFLAKIPIALPKLSFAGTLGRRSDPCGRSINGSVGFHISGSTGGLI